MSLSLFEGRLENLARRVLDRLEFFPFTIAYALVHAARHRDGPVESAGAASAGAALPGGVMLWLGRVAQARPSGPIDVRLHLARDGDGSGVPDAFSAALAFPRVRCIELSWDGAAAAALGGEIASAARLPRGEFELPPAAARDAQTLLKRHAGGAAVVLVNLPEAMDVARPDVHFLQLDASWGFTLHERLALACAADAYIGAPDPLGCAALLAGRPALVSSAPAAGEVGAFLARHFGAAPAATPARSSTSPGS